MTNLQQKLLSLLKDIDSLCRKNGVEYYLWGGTLIGAIRHHGFIPWDDDADIVMTRDNWNKFLEVTKDQLPEGIIISSMDLNPDLAMPVNHYVDTGSCTIYRYHITNPEITGTPIDIQIMDPVPEGKEAHDKYIEAILNLQDYTNAAYFYALRNIVHPGAPTDVQKYKRLEKRIGKEGVIKEIGKEVFHYPVENARYYVQRYGNAPLFYPIELFGKPRDVRFEDAVLMVPSRAEDVLVIAYGDWMNIPRGGSTKTSHDFAVRTEHTPSKLISDKFESVIDREAMMKVYDTKKKIQLKNSRARVESVINKDCFLAARVCLDYEKRLKDKDPLQMLAEHQYDELEELFRDYISVQCSDDYTGSPSVIGWKRWYRKHIPLLIDIGDDPIAVCVRLLIFRQKISQAQKILNARNTIERPYSEALQEAVGIYTDTRNAVSLYHQGSYDETREIITGSLKRCYDNPYLRVLETKLQISQDITDEQKLQSIGACLQDYPENEELLLEKAKILFSQNHDAEAVSVLFHIVSFSDNGIVLTAIKDLAEEKRNLELLKAVMVQLGFEQEEILKLDEASDDEDDSDEVTLDDRNPEEKMEPDSGVDDEINLEEEVAETTENGLTGAQKVRLQLLREIDQICRSENIIYMIWANALVQAATVHSYVDTYGGITIAMTVDNALKFLRAVEEKKPENRFVNCMKTNPDYHRFNMLYCDTSTLEMDVNQCGAGSHFGIYVNIEILRIKSGPVKRDRFLGIIENGWQQQNYYNIYSRKAYKDYTLVKGIRKIRGKKTAGQLFDWFCKDGAGKDAKKYYIKPFKKKRQYVDGLYINGTEDILFEDILVMAPKMYEVFLANKFKRAPLAKDIRYTAQNQHNHIVDPDISSDEYLAYLKEHHTDRVAIWNYNKKANKNYAKVLTLDAKIKTYWNRMFAIGEHYRLKEIYDDKIPELLALLKAGKYEELTQMMQEYITSNDLCVRRKVKIEGLEPLPKLYAICKAYKRSIAVMEKYQSESSAE